MPLISKITPATIREAAKALARGDLVAFPTETVYGLGADAKNEIAVKKIYEAKGRPADHPLIVHISNLRLISEWTRQLPDYANKLAIAFWPGPMTLILPRTQLAGDFITGGQDSVGIRIPNQKNALSLLEKFEKHGGLGVAAPSANRFGKVSPTTAGAVEEELGAYLSLNDKILDGGLCNVGLESTIIDCTSESPMILRPGAITQSMIFETTNMNPVTEITSKLKAPGLLASHYAPNAQVVLDQNPQPGDGFIALKNIKTPPGVNRLAAPTTIDELARTLYESLRYADRLQIKSVHVHVTDTDGIATAIRDRLVRAAHKTNNLS